MKQEIGETRDAMIEADEKIITKIIHANRHIVGKYWIVIFLKQSVASYEGKPTLTKFIKAYFNNKPKSMVGLIIGTVDNAKGDIDWEVNHHDIPFNFDALGLMQSEQVANKSNIGDAYIYNK
jgi:hypothetical protein